MRRALQSGQAADASPRLGGDIAGSPDYVSLRGQQLAQGESAATGLRGRRSPDRERVHARHHTALASRALGGVVERAPRAALVLARLGAAHAVVLGDRLDRTSSTSLPASPKT